jgi:alanyl-tRNA synthetase
MSSRKRLHRTAFLTTNSTSPAVGGAAAGAGLGSDATADIKWPVDRVRSTFLNYFKDNHEHKYVQSSPVVPYQDDTIIFANAGMNQFKSIFTGTIEPTNPLASLTRAVNTQKCIRAGGKHNDLSDVGKDVYHHTFFEMLGTWSFGNYFKKESIEWAYDLLVNVYGLPPDRLYASYFAGDEALGVPCDNEAKEIWLQFLPPERVLPFSFKENFWEMGDVGPCGPCSEIHFDRIGGRDAAGLVNADDPDVIEIWNLVFMQYTKDIDGTLAKLPHRHVDTGMGLERLTSILQGVRSNYDTDVFSPLLGAIHGRIGGGRYAGRVGAADAQYGYRDMAYRVIADHARTVSFAIADGAVPANEGRGYVLRRILRRAFRYTRQTLEGPPDLLSSLVPVVAASYGDLYPGLSTSVSEITNIIGEEERSFSALLDRGIKYFDEASSSGGGGIISGDQMFFMYDTLGFPPDLTELMAEEKGKHLDLLHYLYSII